MRVLALFFISLLTATCFADSGASLYGAGHGVAAGGVSCGGSSEIINSYDLTDNGTQSLSTDVSTQSITIGSATNLHSIVVYFGYALSCNATLRIDDDLDMSSEYLATKTVTNQSTGDITFDFSSDEISLPTGTLYVGIVEDSGDCRWRYSRDNPYGGGSQDAVGTGWVADAPSGTYDFHLKVNECQ